MQINMYLSVRLVFMTLRDLLTGRIPCDPDFTIVINVGM